MSNVTGVYFALKRLEIHDGPGVRTTLFLKGCSLRCKWCHNPEGLSRRPQLAHYAHKCVSCGNCTAVCAAGAHTISDGKHLFDREKCVACGRCVDVCPAEANVFFGKTVTPEEILPELLLDRPFFEMTGGGVTLSGGEPLTQPEFVFELLRLLKKEGIHTAIDTSLAVPGETLRKAAGLADLFLCDLKCVDSALSEELIGIPSGYILDNFRLLDSLGVPMEVRYPMVCGYNDREAEKAARFLSGLHNVKRVKVLPYHDYAKTKYAALGIDYPAGNAAAPDEERLRSVQELFDSNTGSNGKETSSPRSF
ncbi:MAG: glycyl-radical enzyme activating protein [Clostridia bacterium]|nr:glycyl-radical enzyme activating protein [Clostridia bacterium]